jgi:predicted small metal-binding protein
MEFKFACKELRKNCHFKTKAKTLSELMKQIETHEREVHKKYKR